MGVDKENIYDCDGSGCKVRKIDHNSFIQIDDILGKIKNTITAMITRSTKVQRLVAKRTGCMARMKLWNNLN